MEEAQREHQPVLVTDVLRLLDPQPGEVILDGTVGLGGHAAALLPRIMPGGRYIGLDLDAEMLRAARARISTVAAGAVELCQANYADYPETLERLGLRDVDHMLLDLGVNSAQLSDPVRGFSLDRDGPLDMRYDQGSSATKALDLVNALPERELADLFYHNAQEGMSRRIAKRICQVRRSGRIRTTLALARAVESAIEGRAGRIQPATRVFQALRIAVNDELENLRLFMTRVADHLRAGGKLAVISFHSLEDGIVKRALRESKKAGTLEELTSRPVIAGPPERRANPRSRSAKMRVARRQ